MSTLDEKPKERGSILGWALLGLLIGYTYLIHNGIGPEPGTDETWYTPSSFLFSAPVISEMFETIGQALAVFGLPALMLAIAVFLSNRSALARAISVSCVLATLCYVYYGVEADRVWTFFHWRASAVLTLMTFAVGFAASAPFLAESWLRLGWPARIASYLPFVLVVLGFVRNSTGTDQSLRFALSPWPAVAVFGIELGGLFVLVLLVGLALGVGGIAAARAQTGAAAFRTMAVGIALGIAVPALLLVLGDWLHIFPFNLELNVIVAMGFATALAIAIGATLRVRGRPDALRLRARRIAVGAALLGLPLITSQALARYDYYVTRETDARAIIDALESYLEREEIYPDELDELITAGDIEEIPEPRIGFGFLYDDPFRYRSFGTSFILEFPAPRWVECAYTPPWDDEDDEDYDDNEFGVGSYDDPVVSDDSDEGDIDVAANADDDGDDDLEGDDSLDEAWSCPSAPPELW